MSANSANKQKQKQVAPSRLDFMVRMDIRGNQLINLNAPETTTNTNKRSRQPKIVINSEIKEEQDEQQEKVQITGNKSPKCPSLNDLFEKLQKKVNQSPIVIQSSSNNSSNNQQKIQPKSTQKNQRRVKILTIEQQNLINSQNQPPTKPIFPNLDGLFQKLSKSSTSGSAPKSTPKSTAEFIPKSTPKSTAESNPESTNDQSSSSTILSSSSSSSSDSKPTIQIEPQIRVKTPKELAEEALLKTLELDQLKNRKFDFETLVNLPKFGETYTRVDTFLFHCKVCRKDKPIKLRNGSDKAKLLNHVACQQHKKSLEAPQIDGINGIEALNRALILEEFYFVNVAEDNKQYYCELCEKVFVGRGVYKLIKKHEGTKKHLTKERDAFGMVFSREVEYDDEGQIVVVNYKQKTEPPEEKLKIMQKVHDELKVVFNNVFALKEIEMNVQNGETINPLKTLNLTCTKCDLAFDPVSYYYLKRNVVEHLNSERHRAAVQATKRKRKDQLGKLMQNSNNQNNKNKEKAPKPVRVRYHRKKIQKLARQLNNNAEQNMLDLDGLE